MNTQEEKQRLIKLMAMGIINIFRKLFDNSWCHVC